MGQVAPTGCGQRVASKPLKHNSVRFLRSLLEDGVAAARHHQDLGTAQYTVEVYGGAQADDAVAIAPNQQRWNPLDALDRFFKLDHFGTPAANDAEDMAQGGRASQAIGDFLQTSIGNAVGASIHLAESQALYRRRKIGKHPRKDPAPRAA